MATQWVLDKISDAVQPTIQSGVSTAGSYAGGAFTAVGGGINSIGQSINRSISTYGNGVADYGNGILDWTGSSSKRAQTASNPLGLDSGRTGGRRAVTTPSIYSAPRDTTSKLPPPKSRTTASNAVPKKVAGKPATKGPVRQIKTGATPVPKATNAVNSATSRKAVAVKPNSSAKPGTGKPVTRTPVKSSASSATRTQSTLSHKPNHIAAANPLGLS